MRVLIGCECSGRVRDAFIARGHDAWSCDILPSRVPGPHLQCDVLEVLDQNWDLGIFHPCCRYLAGSGLHWNAVVPGRWDLTFQAIRFARRLLDAPIEKICLENPVGILSSAVRPPDQIIQPYQFGHSASKRTCLWLKNLSPLVSVSSVRGRVVNGLMRWDNQTDSGQNRESPGKDRWYRRAQTYQGIADAMAEQWSVDLWSLQHCEVVA